MLGLYILISGLLMIISLSIHKKLVNPVIIYNGIWALMVFFYEIKLVFYYELSISTWLILITSTIVFDIGCFLGFLFSNRFRGFENNNIRKYNLTRIILITSILSSIAIIPNFVSLATEYGFLNLINSVSEVYTDRVEGGSYIGYFSPFVNVSLIFSGILFINKGWNKVLVLPILLSILNALSFGGRNNIIISLLSIVIPIIFSKNFKKLRFKHLLSIFAVVMVFYFVFNVINVQRSSVTSISSYAGSFIVNLNARFPGVYKFYTYFTTPLGVLNEYIKNPFHSFGANTFLPIYKQLSKIGFNIDLIWTLPFYMTPIPSNVGTYLTELIIDFSIGGAFILILLISTFIGILYHASFEKNNLRAKLLFSVMMIIIIMSFFMWYVRSINIWIIFIGVILFSSNKMPYITIKKPTIKEKSR